MDKLSKGDRNTIKLFKKDDHALWWCSYIDAITATVRVEMKKLSSLFGVADMGFKRTLANFLHNQSIHFIHFDETLIMQYILPTSELAD